MYFWRLLQRKGSSDATAIPPPLLRQATLWCFPPIDGKSSTCGTSYRRRPAIASYNTRRWLTHAAESADATHVITRTARATRSAWNASGITPRDLHDQRRADSCCRDVRCCRSTRWDCWTRVSLCDSARDKSQRSDRAWGRGRVLIERRPPAATASFQYC